MLLIGLALGNCFFRLLLAVKSEAARHEVISQNAVRDCAAAGERDSPQPISQPPPTYRGLSRSAVSRYNVVIWSARIAEWITHRLLSVVVVGTISNLLL